MIQLLASVEASSGSARPFRIRLFSVNVGNLQEMEW